MLAASFALCLFCLHTHCLSHPPWRHMASGGSRPKANALLLLGSSLWVVRSAAMRHSPKTRFQRGRIGPQTVRATPDCWVNHPRPGWQPRRISCTQKEARARSGQVRMANGLGKAKSKITPKQRQPRRWDVMLQPPDATRSLYCRIPHPCPRTPCRPRGQKKYLQAQKNWEDRNGR